MFNIIKKIFGTANDREIARLSQRVDAINALEPFVRKLSDQELTAKTAKFKERLDNGEDIESIVNESFAVVREAGARVLGQRHFDVQIMGGLTLHTGRIAEMKTGEGKTLAATLPVYTNALTGKGVHVVTVNDYLARRDAAWMGKIYSFLGLKTGTIVHGLNEEQRRDAYGSDITYGTNNEFGFDYLRDNMKFIATDFVQRGFNFAIVDEVDSILIDEARTPLIISGPTDETTELYERANRIIPKLDEDIDYTLDEKARSSVLTEEGVGTAERLLGVKNLYDPSNMGILHHVGQALKAHTLFEKDRDYIVADGKVVIVDEFTGRLMPGRRFSDGLHQALEAKERVKIENENQTLASITFQNYFRMYSKLAGMTGTADTEAAEFSKIYNLDVVVMPTHKKMIRVDHTDVVYRTSIEKYRAVVNEIERLYLKGQPVLVGTISINNSENVSKLLTARRIPHQVLNAKHHEKEAQIVANAGQPGMVTISTNMAGRGTDIVLGQGVPELGGLFILGTERHESRRIDNQLRGRSGRQGDPGESRFYLSMTDDLMRIFGGDRFSAVMTMIGMTKDVPLESPVISRGIESAQKQVESRNFEIRKHLLDYDDVMNRQREVIYSRRRHILANQGSIQEIIDLIDEESQVFVIRHFGDRGQNEDVNWPDLLLGCRLFFGFDPDQDEMTGLDNEGRMDYILDRAKVALEKKVASIGEDKFRSVASWLMLSSLDTQWKDHLLNMDRLKEGIGLRGYAQKDPLREYQREGFEMFEEMVGRIRTDSLAIITSFRLNEEAGAQRLANGVGQMLDNDDANNGQDAAKDLPPSIVNPLLPRRKPTQLVFSHGNDSSDGQLTKQTQIRSGPKIGRNEPCPCGSGKKYKHCHGSN
ncbi:MAG: preprotein translocase subunit SecA [Deltaproteobacteria bacterium]|jgi:preprotein translocase subunit SecA|nr:preprotein translocase subunit SecA [Deltaproteobacteria bacterium]